MTSRSSTAQNISQDTAFSIPDWRNSTEPRTNAPSTGREAEQTRGSEADWADGLSQGTAALQRKEFLSEQTAPAAPRDPQVISIAEHPPVGVSLYSVEYGAPTVFLENGWVCVPNIRHSKLVSVVPQGPAYLSEKGLAADLTLIFDDGSRPVNFTGFPLTVIGQAQPDATAQLQYAQPAAEAENAPRPRARWAA